MSEDKLLSDSVRLFSERCPEKRGQLFHVSNERNNQKQVWVAKAKGIFGGVADLLYFESKYWNIEGVHSAKLTGSYIVGIELKVPGSYHDRQHIINQIEWAEILERQGGVWRLCRTAEEAFSCTQLDFKGLTIEEVKKMLTEQKTKSIKF
jgi:hypothetical protein